MSLLKSFFVSLGLEFEGEQFARAEIAVALLHKGLDILVEKFKEVTAIIPEMVNQLTEQAGELEKARIKTGVATDSLQELSYAASQTADLGLSSVVSALQQLSRHMEDARKKGGNASEAFRKLGVTFAENGKLRDTQDVLMDVADALAKLPDGTERTAQAMKVLGRQGASLLPFLSKGSAGIEELREEARQLGLVMSESLIADAQANDEAQKRLKGAWQGIKNIFGGPFLQMAADRANAMSKFIMQNKELINTIAHKAFGAFFEALNAIRRIAKMLVDGFVVLASAVGSLVKALFELSPVITIIAGAIATLTTATLIFGGSAAAAALPWIILGTLLAIVLLTIEDIYTTMTGGEGIILDLAEKWMKAIDDWAKPQPGEWWVTTKIKEATKWLIHLHEKWADFKGFFTNFGENLGALDKKYRGLSDADIRKMGIDPDQLGQRGAGFDMNQLSQRIEQAGKEGRQVFYTKPINRIENDVPGEGQYRAVTSENSDTAGGGRPAETTFNGGIHVTIQEAKDSKDLQDKMAKIVREAMTAAVVGAQTTVAQ